MEEVIRAKVLMTYYEACKVFLAELGRSFEGNEYKDILIKRGQKNADN